ncbi:restriction endonuclease subunit S [Aeromonas sp. 23P]|uniref:restriction endonuclease subunit S n=1 Tax=unclassified Aeromonas TaxID=257493 RepID=UPI003F78F215
MGNNWPVLPLEKIAKVIDSRHKTPQYSDIGYPMVRVVDVKGGELSLTDTKNVTSDVYADFSKGRDPEIGDLIISRVGSYGNVSYVSSKQKFCLGQNTALIIPKDNDRFLYYALVSPQLRRKIDNMAVGAVQKTISLKSIRELEIPQPPAQERAEIANFLSSLDDKITLNRQINQTLEQMAQALFKSWFVDFDPVVDNALDAGFFEQDLAFPDELLRRAEARKAVREHADFKPLPDATRQLFPTAFEECAEPSVGLGGWVPQGWKHGCVADVARYSAKRIDTEELTLENYISTENMLADRKGIQSAANLPTVNSVPAYTTGSILISNIRPYFKKIWLANGNGGHSNDVLGFEAKDSDTECYVFNLMYQDSFFDFMMATSKGSKMPRGDKKAILEWGLIVPPLNLRLFFSERVSKFYTSSDGRHHENITLAQLRDTLLPKLISGELRLDNIATDLAKEEVA